MYTCCEVRDMLTNDPLKLGDTINTFLINQNIILYHSLFFNKSKHPFVSVSFSLNIYEYPKYC